MSLTNAEEQRVREIVQLTLQEVRPEMVTMISTAVSAHTATCALTRENKELKFGMKALALIFGTGAVAGFFGSAVKGIATLAIQAMTTK